MSKITHEGEFDHMFTDDRDTRIDAMPPHKRTPSYGRNSLMPPNRPLTEAEAAIVRTIGIGQVRRGKSAAAAGGGNNPPPSNPGVS